jgi:hypothetical protein
MKIVASTSFSAKIAFAQCAILATPMHRRCTGPPSDRLTRTSLAWAEAGELGTFGVTMHDLRYEFTCNAAPVQVEGSVDGARFYFRARHGEWLFAISRDPAVDPADVPANHSGSQQGIFPGASYMPHETALAIIRECLAASGGATPN